MEAVSRRLEHAGIIAHLYLNLPLQELLEIGDAFLATPLAATVIGCNHPQAEEAIAMLRRRSGGHMLLGASGVVNRPTLLRVIAAGAQFIMAPTYDHRLADCAQSLGAVYLPGVFTRAEAGQAYEAKQSLVHLFPSDIFGPDHVEMLTMLYPGIRCIASGGVLATDVALYARNGACGVLLGTALVGDGNWTQTEIISEARRLLDVWRQNTLIVE